MEIAKCYTREESETIKLQYLSYVHDGGDLTSSLPKFRYAYNFFTGPEKLNADGIRKKAQGTFGGRKHTFPYSDRTMTHIIGKSAAFIEMIDLVEKISRVKSPALITGETGTGKEQVVREIYMGSDSSGEFIKNHCTSNETLFESDFFGHVKGAFTGATANRVGLLELAKDGIFFLDDISTLTPNLQAKLLRYFDDKRFRKLGDSGERYVDTRVIGASNEDLKNMVANGMFRSDLYYRMHNLTIDVPPLRKRKEDIPNLIKFYAVRFCIENKKDDSVIDRIFSPEVVSTLQEYPWPGNIRELGHMVERCITKEDMEKSYLEPAKIDSLISLDGSNHDGLGKHLKIEIKRGLTRRELNDLFWKSAFAPYVDDGEDFDRKKLASHIHVSDKDIYNAIKRYGLNVQSGKLVRAE
jgi:transcriptional regulator with PAS, ATPase and Fis domain